MAVVKNLMVRAGADFSGLKREMAKAQKTIASFKTSVGNSLKALGLTLSALAIGKVIKDSVKSAMEVESALQQIQRIMGESTNSFLKWANTNAQAFGMAKSEVFKYASVYGNLISGFTKSTGETVKYTEELLKSSAIVASATGRSMQDVMERIRSGLLGNTEAIEDLGIYANVAMIESTEAFRKFANGKSWQQLNYQAQQQIRLMAILEQTTNKYGSEVLNNTAFRQAQFIAQLKNIQLSLGQAFLPIYNFILPALTALANAIGTVINYIAQFTAVLFGKASDTQKQAQATTQQAKATAGLGDATEKAGKKAKKAGKDAKNALASFDEINSLSKNASDGSGSGGAGSGAGIPELVPENSGGLLGNSIEEISKEIQAMSDKFKNVLSELFSPLKSAWDKYGPGVIEQINIAKERTISTFRNLQITLVSIWDNGGKQIVENLASIVLNIVTIGGRIYNEFILPIVNWFINLLNPEINKGMQMVLDGVNYVLSGLKGLTEYLAGDGFYWVSTFLALFTSWKATKFIADVGFATAAIISNTAATISSAAAKVVDKAETLYLQALYAKDAVVKGASTLATGLMTGSIWSAIAAKIVDKTETLYLLALYAKDAIAKGISTTATIAMTVATTAWNIVAGIAASVTTALGAAIAFLTSPIGITIAAIGALIAIGVLLCKNWDTVKATAINVFSSIKNFISGICTSIGTLFSNMVSGITNTIRGITGIFSGVFNGLAGLVKAPMNSIINAINKSLGNIKIDIPNWVPGVGGKSFSIPKIPMLAQGGYIGANSPVMAMIGDNRNEGEIVAPESKLYEQTFRAMMDALSLNGKGNEGETTFIIQNVIDGEVVTEKVIKNINRKGRNSNGPVIVV